MSWNCKDSIFYIRFSLSTSVFFDIFQDHSNELLKAEGIFSFSEIIGSIFESITFKRSLLIQRFYQFVQIEIRCLWLFEAFAVSIILEVPDSFEKSNLYKPLCTPLWLFLDEREFSTITRFFPGEINEAFQNSVPRSIPITWDPAR